MAQSNKSFDYGGAAFRARAAHERLKAIASDPMRRDSGTSPKWAKNRAEWEKAAQDFHAAVAAAYPPGLFEALDSLRAGDATRIDLLLDFLAADPMLFRSGYVKARIARALKSALLTPRQKQQVEGIVLNLIDRRASQEFRDYCRLAFRIDTVELRAALRRKSTDADARAARRANWMLAYLEMRQPEPSP